MIFIAEFVQFIEFVWSNFTAVFFTGVAGGFVAGLLHLWTRRVHEANKAPNWTLFKVVQHALHCGELHIFFETLCLYLLNNSSTHSLAPSLAPPNPLPTPHSVKLFVFSTVKLFGRTTPGTRRTWAGPSCP